MATESTATLMEQLSTADPGAIGKTQGPPPIPLKKYGKAKAEPSVLPLTSLPVKPQQGAKQPISHPKVAKEELLPQTKRTRKPPPPPPPKYSRLVANIQADTRATGDDLTKLHQPIPKPPKRKRQQKLSEKLTLHELTQNYSQSFPLRIAVVSGYHDPYNRSTISNADMYNIHFLKHQKVVTIRDSHNCPYSIPLNSSVQFAIVYDPENKQVVEVKPHTFQTAGKILAAEALPKVVCATKTFNGPNKTSSVEENEILIVRHVQKSKLRGKKVLQVFSLGTRSEKFLPYECKGYFSTEPSLIKLFLPQIVLYLHDAFPCKAILFFGDDFASSRKNFPSGFRTNLITMIEAKTETSLIASTVRDQKNATGREPESSLIDIPIDDAMSVVKVCVIEADDAEETEKLYDYTRSVFGKLDPSKLVSYKPRGSEEIYTTQSLFYATFQKGSEQVGIELHAPAAVYHCIDTPVKRTEVSEAGNEHKTLAGEAYLYQPLDPLSRQDNQQYASLTQQPERVHPMSASSATQARSKFPHTRGPLPPIPSEYTLLQPVVREELDTLPGEVPSPQRMQMESEPLSSSSKESMKMSTPVSKGATRMVTITTDASNIYETLPGDEFLPFPQVRRAVHSTALTSSDKAHIPKPFVPESRQKHTNSQQHTPQNQQPCKIQTSSESAVHPHLTPPHARGLLPPTPSELTTTPLQPVHLDNYSKPHFQRVQHTESKREQSVEDNKMFLLSLSVTQVQNLLEAMSLTRYSDAFATECISGEILAELDEDILQQELGVNSKIHQIRLMKVITGKHSAQNLLTGMDPYGIVGAHN